MGVDENNYWEKLENLLIALGITKKEEIKKKLEVTWCDSTNELKFSIPFGGPGYPGHMITDQKNWLARDLLREWKCSFVARKSIANLLGVRCKQSVLLDDNFDVVSAKCALSESDAPAAADSPPESAPTETPPAVEEKSFVVVKPKAGKTFLETLEEYLKTLPGQPTIECKLANQNRIASIFCARLGLLFNEPIGPPRDPYINAARKMLVFIRSPKMIVRQYFIDAFSNNGVTPTDSLVKETLHNVKTFVRVTNEPEIVFITRAILQEYSTFTTAEHVCFYIAGYLNQQEMTAIQTILLSTKAKIKFFSSVAEVKTFFEMVNLNNRAALCKE